MTAATTYTYDAATPYRPSLENLGGADYESDPTYPPNHTTMPNAEEHNERARNQAGLNRVTPVAIIHVTFNAGAPVISNVRGMRSSLLTTDFTVVDNAAGDTSITWTSSILPASVIPPVLSLAQDVAIDEARAFLIPNGVQVKTLDGGVATDCAFVLLIN